MATHSSILVWRILWTEEPAGYSPWGHKESDATEQLTLLLVMLFITSRPLLKLIYLPGGPIPR